MSLLKTGISYLPYDTAKYHDNMGNTLQNVIKFWYALGSEVKK